LTLYSQSHYSNSGTRGLDALGRKIYVDSALDRELTPTIFAGELGLVLITGNAGDGKTAYLQKLEGQAKSRGAVFDPALPNGYRFTLDGRAYLSNFDGSQDEGDRQNDDVLREFFAPYAGSDASKWPQHDVRLIAITRPAVIRPFATATAPRSVTTSTGFGCRRVSPCLGPVVSTLFFRSLNSVFSDRVQARSPC